MNICLFVENFEEVKREYVFDEHPALERFKVFTQTKYN